VADPTNKTFAPSGALAVARQSHTATRLSDGRVLIAGGLSPSGTLASAEIYDPATGVFSMTGPMSTGRFGHSATALPDGRALIVGGWSGTLLNTSGQPSSYQGQAVGNAEIYDPASGTFTAAGTLNQASYAHGAALRPDGTVLVVGGSNSASPVTWAAFHRAALDRAELYDPRTKMFTSAGKMSVPRDGPTATTLAGGDVLIANGNAAGLNENYTLGVVEIYH
jgi:Galactose oxidase, central domain